MTEMLPRDTGDQDVRYEIGQPAEIKKITKADTDLWLKLGKLRAKSYVSDHNYLELAVLDENGAEYDEYDDTASHFVIVDASQNILATARMLYRNQDQPDMLLPAEKLFADKITHTEKGMGDAACEVSRFIVDKGLLPTTDKGMTSQLLGTYLIRALTDEVIGKDDPVYAVIEPWFRNYLNNLGASVHTIVDEPQFTSEYNSSNLLVTIDPNSMTRSIHQRDLRRMTHPKLKELGMPERFAPFFENDKATKGLGAVALKSFYRLPEAQYDRNLGWMSKEEQARLGQSTVAIAGAGGDGGELAVTLAQSGVGKFKLADPEVFEVGNLNRQAGANYHTLGRNKAEVIAEIIKDINPFAEIEVYNTGVTADTIDDFIAGSDLICDETEYTSHEIGVMIARAARSHDIPVVMALNVGFGSYVTSFSPDGKTFESYLGLSEDDSIEEIASQTVPISRWVPHIPSYADMNIFEKVANATVSTPTVSAGVKMAAAVASKQALNHLLAPINSKRQKQIKYAPKGMMHDAEDGAQNISFPRTHFYISAMRAYMRTKLGKNSAAGY
ncbi:MAG TPA: ThiF family adenylyltransferase [Candidatus Saccharimonadales bacterium]|nr:ThiF family adenylyltransferase [Candidatus Saccharimonadales bacterium]